VDLEVALDAHLDAFPASDALHRVDPGVLHIAASCCRR
jgi:hypothetical protein